MAAHDDNSMIRLKRRDLFRLATSVAMFGMLAAPASALDAAAPAATPVVAPATVTIFAAASLKNALDDIAALWKTQTGGAVALSYASSFPLARQIDAGAPADLFFSADEASMNFLAEKNEIVPASRVNLLGNELVVIAPKTSALDKLDFTPTAFLAALGSGRLAMGDPASVPVGKYGQAAFEKLGLWADVQPRLALADNVRSGLLYVSRGETPLGVVYATDANAAPEVKVIARFPANTHAPIVYPVALTKAAKGDAPEKFLAFLKGPEARKSFEKQGFTVLK